MQCPICGRFFKPKQHTRQFCGVSCSAKATARARGQGGTVVYTCKQCGKRFEDFAGNKRVFCCKACEVDSHRKPRPKCEICGKPVRLMRNRYCSKHCSNAARPKPGFTSWQGFYQRAQQANPTPQPCVTCGKPGKHRHHPDYRSPETVIWFCTTCHRHFHSGTNHGIQPKQVPVSK